jgi:hypothetical protein
MKTFCIILTAFFLCIPATDIKADGLKDKIKGKWEVNVPAAPYGYQDYTIDVTEKDKTLLVDIKGSGVDIKGQKLTEKDGKLTTQIYIDEYITVTIWLEKDAVKATADTSAGQLNCNFKRPEIKK